MKSLDKLGAGERAYIVDMKNSRLCEKLFEMGVFPGAIVEVQFNADDHSSIIVKINGHTYNIFRPAAETIITNAVLFEMSLN